ncbi:MAG: LCP family protein [Propionibacteriaceae bacterium]|jgi:LCP family protein required for cell wall assembly|nr:LCP family protein [Propionibacteriaceae bacterium]
MDDGIDAFAGIFRDEEEPGVPTGPNIPVNEPTDEAGSHVAPQAPQRGPARAAVPDAADAPAKSTPRRASRAIQPDWDDEEPDDGDGAEEELPSRAFAPTEPPDVFREPVPRRFADPEPVEEPAAPVPVANVDAVGGDAPFASLQMPANAEPVVNVPAQSGVEPVASVETSGIQTPIYPSQISESGIADEPAAVETSALEPDIAGIFRDEPEADAAATPSRYGRVLGWTILGGIIPGLGLIKAGRKVVGGIVLGAFVLLVGAVAGAVFLDWKGTFAKLMNTNLLFTLAVAALVIAALWVIVIGCSHLALRQKGASKGQRFAGALVVGALSMVIVAPAALGANILYTSATMISTVFSPEDDGVTVPTLAPEDPWKDKPRLNVLLLGADSSPEYYGRSEKNNNIRTDTVIVASIDTHSGATTLISLPRQTAHMPFPEDSPLYEKFPDGFYDGKDGKNAEFMLNAMWRNLPNLVPDDILGNSKTISQDALKLSVGAATGLDIDYYVMVNLDGFIDFVSAIGGITVNVNYRIPMGGSKGPGYDNPPKAWIEPGPNQHLTGKKALWFARGRYGLDDYSRIERQRCVINAIVQQATPETVLTSYQSISAAASKSIRTDIPADMLPALLELAGKVQGTTLHNLYFVNNKNGFVSTDPNFKKMRSQVKAALEESAADNPDPSATPTASETVSPVPTASGTTPAATTGTTPTSSTSASPSTSSSASPTATAKPKSDDLDDACAYNPGKYKLK